MDLSYGEEYDRYRDEVRAFLSDNWPPKGAGQGALASGAGRSLSYLYNRENFKLNRSAALAEWRQLAACSQ